jgi:hypothetical protein
LPNKEYFNQQARELAVDADEHLFAVVLTSHFKWPWLPLQYGGDHKTLREHIMQRTPHEASWPSQKAQQVEKEDQLACSLSQGDQD